MSVDEKQGSWWQTIPGVISAVAALIGSLGVLLATLHQLGVFPYGPPSTLVASPTSVPTNPTARLPDVTGMPFAEASRVLRSLGFADIRKVPRFSAGTGGTVIEQVPKPETDLPLDQLVNLTVAEPSPLHAYPPSQPSAPSPSVSEKSDFAGIWEEIPPLTPQDHGRPMLLLKLQQNGSEVSVQFSRKGPLRGALFAQARVERGEASWIGSQRCPKQLQHAGYNYDNPDSGTFTLRLDGAVLLLRSQIHWNSPCGDHQIGVATEIKRLHRAAPSPATTAAFGPTTSGLAAPPGLHVIDKKFLLTKDSPIYDTPDVTGQVIGKVPFGRFAHATGIVGDWFRVQLKGGAVGYIPVTAARP